MLQICAAGPSLLYSYYVLSFLPLHSLSIPQCTPCGSARRSHRGHPRSWSWQIPQQSGSSSGSLCTDSTLRPAGPAPTAPRWRPTHRRWHSISGIPVPSPQQPACSRRRSFRSRTCPGWPPRRSSCPTPRSPRKWPSRRWHTHFRTRWPSARRSTTPTTPSSPCCSRCRSCCRCPSRRSRSSRCRCHLPTRSSPYRNRRCHHQSRCRQSRRWCCHHHPSRHRNQCQWSHRQSHRNLRSRKCCRNHHHRCRHHRNHPNHRSRKCCRNHHHRNCHFPTGISTTTTSNRLLLISTSSCFLGFKHFFSLCFSFLKLFLLFFGFLSFLLILFLSEFFFLFLLLLVELLFLFSSNFFPFCLLFLQLLQLLLFLLPGLSPFCNVFLQLAIKSLLLLCFFSSVSHCDLLSGLVLTKMPLLLMRMTLLLTSSSF